MFIKKHIQKQSISPKSIDEVMDNAYKIAESSGFYIPYRKYDWYKAKNNQNT